MESDIASKIFVGLILLTLWLLAIGLIKPSIYSFIFRREMTRQQIGIFFGVAFWVFFILIGISAPERAPEQIVKEKTEEQEVPFATITKNDPRLETGEEIHKDGENGLKVLTYKVTYTKRSLSPDKEIDRELIAEEVTKEPVDELVIIGTKIVAEASTDTKSETQPEPVPEPETKPELTPPPKSEPQPMGPMENVQASAENVLGDKLVETNFNPDNGVAVVTFRVNYSFWKREQLARDVVKTAKRIYEDEGAVQEVYFEVIGSVEDVYGNYHDDVVWANVGLYKSTAELINMTNFNWENFPYVAEYYKEKVNLD